MRGLQERLEGLLKEGIATAHKTAKNAMHSLVHSGEDRLAPWQGYRLLSSFEFYGIKGIRPLHEGVGYVGKYEDTNGIKTKICFMEYTPANDPLVTIICMTDAETGERKEELYVK